MLLGRIWNGKILRDHPEMAAHLDAVIGTVHLPDHVAADPRDERFATTAATSGRVAGSWWS